MRITAVAANAYQLTRWGFVNCYLIREADGLTLVDTGLPGSQDAILSVVGKLGGPLRRIILTHAHMDHVGSVDALVVRLSASGVELLANARSLPLLQKPPHLSLLAGEPQVKIKGSLSGIKSRPTRLLEEDDLVGSLRTIETPGHIPGHLAFLDQRDGTLYAGDALVGMGHLTVTGYAPWFFPLPNFGTWDKPTAVASARKLLDYPIERFACGHGGVQSGGLPALAAAILKTGAGV
jgi:glyoxylase-like metal-dependent hydrolase (beta-lactamase superfamily II)